MSQTLSRRSLAALAFPAFASEPWQSIFDGHSLNGWSATGNASWSVEGGCLVGRQGPGGAAGDLFTNEQWSNFEVSCEWRMKWPGNSGLWFRSTSPRTGYQADFLDQPSHPGVLSGSLYCMGKAFIAENRNNASVHKDSWNTLLVRAAGDQLSIEMNGRKVISVRDATFPGPGSIGLQVHPGDAFKGMEVRVRKIRLRVLSAPRA